jgi:hypothetical protein
MQFFVKNQDYITDTDMESWRLNGQYASQHIPYIFY